MTNYGFETIFNIEGSAYPASEQEGARRARENLSRLTARYTFIIGTCALLHPKFPEMMDNLAPILRENNKSLIVPDSVINDLQRLVVKNPEMTVQISEVIHLLAGLRLEGLVQVCGNGTDFNSRNHLLQLAEEMLEYTEPLVITQNKRLSEELVQLNRTRPTAARRLAVSRVNHYGFLSRYIPQSAAVPHSTALDPLDLRMLSGDFPLGA